MSPENVAAIIACRALMQEASESLDSPLLEVTCATISKDRMKITFLVQFEEEIVSAPHGLGFECKLAEPVTNLDEVMRVLMCEPFGSSARH